jgi:hypothetical protein
VSRNGFLQPFLLRYLAGQERPANGGRQGERLARRRCGRWGEAERQQGANWLCRCTVLSSSATQTFVGKAGRPHRRDSAPSTCWLLPATPSLAWVALLYHPSRKLRQESPAARP